MPNKKHFATKIILVGDPTVGKTSLRRSYLGKTFQANYLTTVGADFSIFSYTVNNTMTSNALWDIAGQDLYKVTQPRYFMGSQAAIIVYDVTNKKSFENINIWLGRFREYSKIGMIVSLVGNKIDLNSEITEEEHTLKIKELEDKYPEYLFLSFMTSAKTGNNIQNCVQSTVDHILKASQKESEKTMDIEPNIESYIPTAYIISYDIMTGPSIVKKSPNREITDREFINTMKITTMIDMDLLADSPHVEGSTPWNDPVGYLYYLAFVNILNKKSDKMFIISFVCDRNINDLIAGRSDIVSGFFHRVMNEFNRILIKSEDKVDQLARNTADLDTILLKLRIDIFNLIKDDL